MNKGKNENRDERKRPSEPYQPEDTPKPPHVIDPHSEPKKQPDDTPSSSDERVREKPDANMPSTPTKEGNINHLLSDEADIDDETTI